jgi:hypothetical protein
MCGFDQRCESRSNPERTQRRDDHTNARCEQPDVHANYDQSCDTSNTSDEPSSWAGHVMPTLALVLAIM